MPVFSSQRVLKNFYVFEGIDGVGKSFQGSLVADLLEANLFVTQEPTHTEIGRLIRSLFRKATDPLTMALLFAADRNEHIFAPETGIYARCKRGTRVLCDRYFFSSYVYQGAHIAEERIWELNRHFPLPEKVFFFDLPPEQCLERIKDRNTRDHVETLPALKRARSRYFELFDNCRGSAMQVHRVDASMKAEDIASRITNIIAATDTKHE